MPILSTRFASLIQTPSSLLKVRISSSHPISPARAMSSAQSPPPTDPNKAKAAHRREWLVHLPDHADALARRIAVRDDHLAAVKPKVADGTILMGGATFDRHPSAAGVAKVGGEGGTESKTEEEEEAPRMTGSAMLVRAESEAEVWEMVRQDVYAKSRVWDLSAVRVWPFRVAVQG